VVVAHPGNASPRSAAPRSSSRGGTAHGGSVGGCSRRHARHGGAGSRDRARRPLVDRRHGRRHRSPRRSRSAGVGPNGRCPGVARASGNGPGVTPAQGIQVRRRFPRADSFGRWRAPPEANGACGRPPLAIDAPRRDTFQVMRPGRLHVDLLERPGVKFWLWVAVVYVGLVVLLLGLGEAIGTPSPSDLGWTD